MRESEFYSTVSEINRRILILNKQAIFFDMRIQSFERVLKLRWSLLKALFNPSWILSEVNRIHLILSKEHDEEVRQRIEEGNDKTKITLVSADGVVK